MNKKEKKDIKKNKKHKTEKSNEEIILDMYHELSFRFETLIALLAVTALTSIPMFLNKATALAFALIGASVALLLFAIYTKIEEHIYRKSIILVENRIVTKEDVDALFRDAKNSMSEDTQKAIAESVKKIEVKYGTTLDSEIDELFKVADLNKQLEDLDKK